MTGVWLVLSAKGAGFSCIALSVEALEALTDAFLLHESHEETVIHKEIARIYIPEHERKGDEIEQPFVPIKVFRLFWRRVWRLRLVMSLSNS